MNKIQYFTEQTETTQLSKGKHSIELSYFHCSGKALENVGMRNGASLSLRYGLKGVGWMNQGGFGPIPIPPEMLCNKVDELQITGPTSGGKISSQLREDNEQLMSNLQSATRRSAALEHQVMELKAQKMNAEHQTSRVQTVLESTQAELQSTRAELSRISQEQLDLQSILTETQTRINAEQATIERMIHFNAVALAIKMALGLEGIPIRISNSEMFAMAESQYIQSSEWVSFVRKTLVEEAASHDS